MTDQAPASTARVPLPIILAVAAGFFVLDQVTKVWALAALEQGQYQPLLGSVLGFELVFNPGAAFSFAEGMTWVFTVVAIIVAVVIIRVSRRLRSRSWAWVLAGLLGGNLGNLCDRLFRDPGFGRGHVVDFINYNGYFVGNVADIFIVVAAGAMAVLTFRGIGFDGRRIGGGSENGSSEGTEGDAEDGAEDGADPGTTGVLDAPAEDAEQGDDARG